MTAPEQEDWRSLNDDPGAFRCGGNRPSAPSLHSASNSEARNHGDKNSKQNLYQTNGICWHRTFLPIEDDAEAAHCTGRSLIISSYQCTAGFQRKRRQSMAA